MNASARTSFRISSFRAAAWLAVLALSASLLACDKKADADTSPSGASTAAAAPAAGKKAATTLKLADVKKAYKAEFDDMSKAALPMDKKIDAFVAKVGKPESDTGRNKIWYALDGDKCTKVTIDGKDGSITEESTTAANCGM